MSNNLLSIATGVRRIIVVAIACVACSSSSSTKIVTEIADSAALQNLKTFALTAPTPATQVAVAATNDSNYVGAAVMDMDPMLATSLVGRAIREDLTKAFSGRGYQTVDGNPDFFVAYYAGTGHVVDTRGAQKSYRVGQKITTETYEYPAGTIVVDVVNAKSNSLAWRGVGIAEIPKDPEDYARAVKTTVNKIVDEFPKAG